VVSVLLVVALLVTALLVTALLVMVVRKYAAHAVLWAKTAFRPAAKYANFA
jgi:hypothetical protein